jgi:hypothetical protein
MAEAITLFEQNLADRERVRGADHPVTLASRNRLAAAYQAAGRTAEAIARHLPPDKVPAYIDFAEAELGVQVALYLRPSDG